MEKKLFRYRKNDSLLKVHERVNSKGEKYLRGILYMFKWSSEKNKMVLVKQDAASFLEKDGVTSPIEVKKRFGMEFAAPYPSDSYVNRQHRIIWNNTDFEGWEHAMKVDYPDGVDEFGEPIDLSYERYYEDCNSYLDDERVNLNKPVDGVIVAFANLGLWDGHHNGAKIVGSKVSDILYSDCDDIEWYCSRYNVHCTASHHDGTNAILYRVARDRKQAKELVESIAYEGMTQEAFMKATKSLRPYVAKVYGW